MDDRRTSLVAAAFGSVAIGGFWLVRPIKPFAKIVILDQWAPSEKSGLDGDAAKLIRFELKGLPRDEEHPLVFRIVGKDGASYPLFAASSPGLSDTLKLLRGYRRRLEAPRLVAQLGDRTIASAPIDDLPPPEFYPLIATPNSPIALVYRDDAGLLAEPIRSIPSDERWQVVARRTPYANALEATAMVSPSGMRGSRRLNIPFPTESNQVELDFTRYRLRPESEIVHIEGMRIVRRAGSTTLVVDRDRRVANGLGADIRLPAQDNGPRRPSRHGDTRLAVANLYIVPSWLSRQSLDLRRSRGPKIELLSPTPESLGLRELRIASQSRVAPHEPQGPVRVGPFSATIRVTLFRPIAIETRRMVLPITFGAPLPYSPSSFVGDPFPRDRRSMADAVLGPR